MKYIQLKEVTTRKGEQVRLNYAQQIELIVGEAMDTAGGQRQGFDRETNRRALRVLDALDEQKDGGVLALEDADHAFLVARVNQFIWPFADRCFEEFCDAIEHAQTKPRSVRPAPGIDTCDRITATDHHLSLLTLILQVGDLIARFPK